jgi:hypothetical protein
MTLVHMFVWPRSRVLWPRPDFEGIWSAVRRGKGRRRVTVASSLERGREGGQIGKDGSMEKAGRGMSGTTQV